MSNAVLEDLAASAIDQVCRRIAMYCVLALDDARESGFGDVIRRSMMANESLMRAHQDRQQLLTFSMSDGDQASASAARAHLVIVTVTEAVETELRAAMQFQIERARADVARELEQLRADVERGARSVLASAHNSRARRSHA